MANELKWNVSGTVVNGSFSDTIPQALYQFTQNAAGLAGGLISVTTAESDFPVGSVTTPGWLFLLNTDATNFVQFGPKSAGVMVVFGRLKAGEFAWLRLDPSVTLRWKADTATCKVLAKLYQD